jgi:hypothetical protein
MEQECIKPSMQTLPSLTCRGCGRQIESRPFEPDHKTGGAHDASIFETCLRQCPACGYGYSNAKTDDVEQLTIVYADPFWNVPNFISAGHAEVLGAALNIRNRPSKLVKFASSKSEDHVTWTIFRYLQRQNELSATLSRSGVHPSAIGGPEPGLLLWGTPVEGDDEARSVHERLQLCLEKLGENPRSRSEPDVTLDFGEAGVTMIEVKLFSPNDRKPADYEGWDKYLKDTDAFDNPQGARASGAYELTRNWRIARELAGSRPMTLVNLGPTGTVERSHLLDEFRKAIRESSSRRFVSISWDNFLAAIPFQPEWLKRYLTDRGLLSRSETITER